MIKISFKFSYFLIWNCYIVLKKLKKIKCFLMFILVNKNYIEKNVLKILIIIIKIEIIIFGRFNCNHIRRILRGWSFKSRSFFSRRSIRNAIWISLMLNIHKVLCRIVTVVCEIWYLINIHREQSGGYPSFILYRPKYEKSEDLEGGSIFPVIYLFFMVKISSEVQKLTSNFGELPPTWKIIRYLYF